MKVNVDFSEVQKIYKESVRKNTDKGSCVLGYNLKLYGSKIVPQPFQGSSGCYNVYKDVSDYLLSVGVDPNDISTDYGGMD